MVLRGIPSDEVASSVTQSTGRELAGDLRGKVVILLCDPPPCRGDDQADRQQASRCEFNILKAGALAVLGLYSFGSQAAGSKPLGQLVLAT